MNVVNVIDPYASVVQDAMTPRSSRGRGELVISRARLPDPAAIPPRRWLYGRILIRGYITVLVAPGGVGKTAMSIAIALSMATGRAQAGDWVYEQSSVLCCTLEDPEDEFDRRLAAGMIHHGISADDIRDRVFVVSGRDRPLLIAALDTDGFTVCYPDKERMIQQVRAAGIGLIIVDPFVNSHELDENNNPHINAAARAWAEIANEADCAVLLVHHTRKGAESGDIEGSRGAKALTDACRVGVTLTAMTAKEAEDFGIPDKDRRLHIRLDDGKANLAPPSDKARWFKLCNVHLQNGEPGTPWHEGDHVQAVETWEPPATFNHTPDELNRVLDDIADGMGKGQLYSTRKSGAGGGPRWVGNVLVRMLEIDEGPAGRIVKTWLSSGLLVETTYTDPVQRKERKGIIVTHGKRPT